MTLFKKTIILCSLIALGGLIGFYSYKHYQTVYDHQAAISCDLINPTDLQVDHSTKKLTLDEAVSRIQSELPIKMKVQAQSICGDIHYAVHNSMDKMIGILGTNKILETAGIKLYTDATQLFDSHKQFEFDIEQVRKSFQSESEELLKDFSITIQDPKELALSLRFPNATKQQFYVSMAQCLPSAIIEASYVGSIYVNTTELIPHKTTYSENNVYKYGDLKKSIASNKDLLKNLQKRLRENYQNCAHRPEYAYFDWKTLKKRLSFSKVQVGSLNNE